MLSSVPAEPDSLVVTTDTGDRIHYLDWGAPPATAQSPSIPQGPQGPPILLVHGLAATAWAWTPVARRLAGATRVPTRVLAMDLRGHGLSDSPRSGYDVESLAFDALTVLAANGYGTDVDGPPAVIAGHGLGAMVAVAAAAVQPASVSGVGLIDGGWEDLAESTRMTAAEFERTIGDPPEVLASMAAYLTDRRDFDPTTWDADQERAARAAVDEKHAGHVVPVVRLHALRSTVEAMFEYEPRHMLATLSVPLYVAIAESGTGDDETAAERRLALEDVLQARSRAGLPPTVVKRYVRAGHNLMRYRPAEIAADLEELLAAAAAHQRS
jgi:pimeloyl-ACP methyl ester carboxylesterase